MVVIGKRCRTSERHAIGHTHANALNNPSNGVNPNSTVELQNPVRKRELPYTAMSPLAKCRAHCSPTHCVLLSRKAGIVQVSWFMATVSLFNRIRSMSGFRRRTFRVCPEFTVVKRQEENADAREAWHWITHMTALQAEQRCEPQ
jgi:hypothetical protein